MKVSINCIQVILITPETLWASCLQTINKVELVSVETDSDDLRLGVKDLSNGEIAGFPRNILKYSTIN